MLQTVRPTSGVTDRRAGCHTPLVAVIPGSSQEWIDLIGPTAASSLAQYSFIVFITGIAIGPAVLVLLLVGFKWHLVPVIVLGYLLIALAIALVIIEGKILTRCCREASVYLGFPITKKNFPPRNRARREEWKLRYGLAK